MSSRELGAYTVLFILLASVLSARGFPRPSPASVQNAATELASTSSAATKEEASTPLYPVVKVIDGDTLVIARGEENIALRLIGLDTPETVDPRKPVQCFGLESSAKAHELLDGKRVRVEQDPSQGVLDKYGRTLAYVYLPDRTLFNKLMIQEGFGHEYTYNLPYTYQKEFKAAEQEARAAKRGLWAPGACGLPKYAP